MRMLYRCQCAWDGQESQCPSLAFYVTCIFIESAAPLALVGAEV